MTNCIECEWKNNNRVIVNPDGQVWPCCYLSNLAYKYDINDDDYEEYERTMEAIASLDPDEEQGGGGRNKKTRRKKRRKKRRKRKRTKKNKR